MKIIKLNNEASVPVLGLGTWQLTGKDCQKAVEKALEVGYRHIDTADVYGNHHEVAAAIKVSNINREKLFLTTKVWRDELDYQGVQDAAARLLEELQTNYLDLLLIHWPNSSTPIQPTLESMNLLKTKGLIKAIGVSNFTINHLKAALKTGVEINNNQVEFHPSFNQAKLKRFCDEQKIVITAYSPLAQGKDLKLTIIQKLAKKYSKSESQVILNWIISKGMLAIPRSKSIEHIEDNFKVLEWALETMDSEEIDQIGGNNRIVNPGFSEFNF